MPQVASRSLVRLIRFGTETLVIEAPAEDHISVLSLSENLVSQLLQVDVNLIFCASYILAEPVQCITDVFGEIQLKRAEQIVV